MISFIYIKNGSCEGHRATHVDECHRISKKDEAVEEPSCNYRAWSKRSIQSDKQEDTSIV